MQAQCKRCKTPNGTQIFTRDIAMGKRDYTLAEGKDIFQWTERKSAKKIMFIQIRISEYFGKWKTIVF